MKSRVPWCSQVNENFSKSCHFMKCRKIPKFEGAFHLCTTADMFYSSYNNYTEIVTKLQNFVVQWMFSFEIYIVKYKTLLLNVLYFKQTMFWKFKKNKSRNEICVIVHLFAAPRNYYKLNLFEIRGN